MIKLENIYYNSYDKLSKNPFGALVINEKVEFNLKDASEITNGKENENDAHGNIRSVIFGNINENFNVKSASFVYYKAKDECFDSLFKIDKDNLVEEVMEECNNSFSIQKNFNDTGLIFYFFKLVIGDSNEEKTVYLSNKQDTKGGLCDIRECLNEVIPYQLTVYKERKTPQWFKDAVFYQIFPDRFFNGEENNQVLNPKANSFIYGSWYDEPMYIKNVHGSIERWDFFGGNLKGITKKLDYLKDLGITAIYLNPIFKARSNHRYDTGDYHKIDEILGNEEDFITLSKEAEKRNMKLMLDGVFNHTGKDSKYFNVFSNYEDVGACQSKDSKYYNWYNFENYPTKYECWWGIDDLPNVNENDQTFRDFILNENDGVVPYWLKKGANAWRLDVADELPDDFIDDIRNAMDKVSEDTVLLGEVWEDASNKIAYSKRRKYLEGSELNSIMNYPFRQNIIEYLIGNFSPIKTYREFMSIKENYPREAFYSNFNFLGTHDTKRIRTELGDDAKLIMAVDMLYTLPGVPSLYYGDEAGLTGNQDPNNRKCYPWGREDENLLLKYKESIGLRKSSEAFSKGEFYPFYQDNMFGYFREYGEELFIVLINNSQNVVNFSLKNVNGLESRIYDEHIGNNLLKDIPIKPNKVKVIRIK